MTRFFMHLRGGSDEFMDPEGIEMPLAGVASAALRAARDCIAWDVRDGLLDMNYRIDVNDEVGTLVYALRFSDAVAFTPLRDHLRLIPA